MKRGDHTLYELSKQRLNKDGQSEDRPPALGDRLQPGASLRLPAGGVVLVVLGILAIAVTAWWAGRSSAPPGPTSALDPGLQPPGLVHDPLIDPGTPVLNSPPPAIAGEAATWFFVLAETRPEGAGRLATYCRQHGLDARVIPGHNTRLARVIALPGLHSASTRTPAYRQLDARIRDLGRRWKDSGGTTDLSDRYLDRIAPDAGSDP